MIHSIIFKWHYAPTMVRSAYLNKGNCEIEDIVFLKIKKCIMSNTARLL